MEPDPQIVVEPEEEGPPFPSDPSQTPGCWGSGRVRTGEGIGGPDPRVGPN